MMYGRNEIFMKRIFLIVLDSFGIGEMEDAASYGDYDVNTLRSCFTSSEFHMPNMQSVNGSSDNLKVVVKVHKSLLA